jgi:hypothetical protein
MSRFSVIALVIGPKVRGTEVEDLTVVTNNLPDALHELATRIANKDTDLDLDNAEVLIIAGVNAEKVDALEHLAKN